MWETVLMSFGTRELHKTLGPRMSAKPPLACCEPGTEMVWGRASRLHDAFFARDILRCTPIIPAVHSF